MPQPLKIIITHYRADTVSGAENSIADFASQVDERFQITMLVPGEGKLANFFRERGLDVWVRRVETRRRLFPGLHQIQSRQLANELRRRGINAVLCNTFHAAQRVGTACQMARLPWAIYMRDYLPDVPINRRVLAQANALFAISNDVIVQHTSMISPDHFRLAYNFINPDAILERGETHRVSGQRLLPFDSDHPVIGLVGRITPYKQPEIFIRAIPEVLREVPEARFVLIGAAQAREKAYEASIRAMPAQSGIQNQVAFLGSRQDAVELTAELSIACLTSGREPLGRVILEANLLGVPVIVPDTGGPAEIVINGETGLHFSSLAPDASSQLAHQIIRLLKDQTLRDCLIQKGRERVFSTFANHRNVEIQEAYIEDLCAEPRKRA